MPAMSGWGRMNWGAEGRGGAAAVRGRAAVACEGRGHGATMYWCPAGWGCRDQGRQTGLWREWGHCV